MLGPNEDSVEYISIGVLDWRSEGIKEGPLLVLEDSNKEGGELLSTVGSIDYIFDGKMVDNSDGKKEGFPVWKSDDTTLGLFYSTTLGVAGSFKHR